jgi:hypothetical protein
MPSAIALFNHSNVLDPNSKQAAHPLVVNCVFWDYRIIIVSLTVASVHKRYNDQVYRRGGLALLLEQSAKVTLDKYSVAIDN